MQDELKTDERGTISHKARTVVRIEDEPASP